MVIERIGWRESRDSPQPSPKEMGGWRMMVIDELIKPHPKPLPEGDGWLAHEDNIGRKRRTKYDGRMTI
jgi:hypothetical protein